MYLYLVLTIMRTAHTVCFFVFDQDKTGFFEEEELKTLMNTLHKVKPGETVKGQQKISCVLFIFIVIPFDSLFSA